MLFNEIYGSYYQVTALVLREAVRGDLTRQRLHELARSEAFSESVLALPQGLEGERWRLLKRDMTTPIQDPPTMPLTLLQKRWLKAVLMDPRVRLFDPDTTGLTDVEPLFTPEMFARFDQYADGDDYADPGYIECFHTILRALREGRRLRLSYVSARGRRTAISVSPHHLEFSEKDDRFRLIASSGNHRWIFTLSGIEACAILDTPAAPPVPAEPLVRVTFELVDIRNALERVLMHFSHLEKETERLERNRYRVTLLYDPGDEVEMVIRILSFGPVIRVTEPEHFIALLRRRIEGQLKLAAGMPGGDGEDRP